VTGASVGSGMIGDAVGTPVGAGETGDDVGVSVITGAAVIGAGDGAEGAIG